MGKLFSYNIAYQSSWINDEQHSKTKQGEKENDDTKNKQNTEKKR